MQVDLTPAADFNRALGCRNAADAFDSLVRAAQDGCLRAQFLVGLAYQTGRGVAVNYELAARWYRRAACGGDGYAMANLGAMSVSGQAPADDAEAYAWVRSAVGLGHAWLRPVCEKLEQRLAGGAAEEGEWPGEIGPESPEFRSCRRTHCDPSRCDVA